MEFSEWNTERDGSGTSYAVGDTVSVTLNHLYAIWVASAPTYLDLSGLTTYDGLIKAEISGKIDIGGKAGQIPFGTVDSTSTATAFTATVDGLTELVDGTTVMLKNGVVTSATDFTINVNGLGAKPVYTNLAAATRDTTIFNVNYTMLFVYDSTRVEGGAWICYRGYDANTNTIGYQLRTNSGNMVASDTGYRYRLWLTQADGKKWVPINTSTSTNGTSARTLNTRPIDPFGRIAYRSTNGTCTAGTGVGATAMWDVYTCTIGYSYVLSLTAQNPVYLRCNPQSNGSAVMEVLTQSLPTSKDGKIYIHLGTAYSATAMELEAEHPVYWHDGIGIRLWTGAEVVTSVNGSTGAITGLATTSQVGAKQDTLVSGTNIKTINGNSILGSGDLTISGGSGAGASYTTQAVSIPTSAWSGTTATVSALAVTATNDVIVAPAPASISAWAAAGVYCSAQGAGTLTFTCSTVPTAALTANVMAFEGGAMILLTLDGVADSGTGMVLGPAITVPAAGATYSAHFETSASYIEDTGDVTVTCRSYGGSMALCSPNYRNGGWVVYLNANNTAWYSDNAFGGETVSLTIYG